MLNDRLLIVLRNSDFTYNIIIITLKIEIRGDLIFVYNRILNKKIERDFTPRKISTFDFMID